MGVVGLGKNKQARKGVKRGVLAWYEAKNLHYPTQRMSNNETRCIALI